MTAAIEVEGLTKTFGAVAALDGITLSVDPGTLFGLVGPDGAGKTTTMRLLAGILTATSGSCRVAGRDAIRDPEGVKEVIGYMSQRFGLYPDLTVAENIRFYADLYGVDRRAREARTERLLAFSALQPFRKRQAGNLSGGMRQKLGLVCALVHTPRVLLLDEPTNGVDPVSRRDFWRILSDLQREGVTLFVSTAYLDEAERCDRVGLLHRGRLLACDTPAGIRSRLGGTVLELRAPDARGAAQVLKAAFGAEGVGLIGDRVHLSVREGGPGEREVRAALAGAGIALEALGTVPPSLEDVFVSVLSGEGRGGSLDGPR